MSPSNASTDGGDGLRFSARVDQVLQSAAVRSVIDRAALRTELVRGAVLARQAELENSAPANRDRVRTLQRQYGRFRTGAPEWIKRAAVGATVGSLSCYAATRLVGRESRSYWTYDALAAVLIALGLVCAQVLFFRIRQRRALSALEEAQKVDAEQLASNIVDLVESIVRDQQARRPPPQNQSDANSSPGSRHSREVADGMRQDPTTLSLDTYTPEAKRLVSAAQRLADNRKHAEQQPLHLLRASLSGFGVEKVLRAASVDFNSLTSAIDSELLLLMVSEEPSYLADATLSLLQRAEKSAERERQRVGVAHLLHALTQELRGPAAEVLTNAGITPGSLRPHSHLLPTSDTAPADGVVEDLQQLAVRDLLVEAASAETDSVVGRHAEIERLVTILERRHKRHPILVGEPGVGKRAVVRGLACRLEKSEVPLTLQNARLLQLEFGELMVGAKRFENEERVKRLLVTLAQHPSSTILVLAAVDELLGTTPSGSIVYELLTSCVRRNDLRLICTTTGDGLRKIREKGPALLRELTVLPIAEPTIAEAAEILRGIAAGFAQHHAARIDDGAILSAVKLAKRYLEGRQLPDSAIDLLDEAASFKKVALRRSARSEPARQGETAARGNFNNEFSLTDADVAATLAVWTGIPAAKLMEGESEKLLGMESRLNQRVVGQRDAVSAVSRAVRRGRAGLRDASKPIGSFLFLGPTGVGKTELAKAVAQFLFDDERSLTRLDMSEFMEKHMAQRLIGSPMGYADSEQGGFLTEAVRRRPYSVLLFDEVEKAHHDVFDLLLQVLDEGRLTDGRGRSSDFSNTVIIMTSNIGSRKILQADPRAFRDPEGREAIRDIVLDELKGVFRPEFINRFDDVVVFHPLDEEELAQVAGIELRKLGDLLAARGIQIVLNDDARRQLVKMGFEPALGARPMKRTIIKQIQDPLAQALLSGTVREGDSISVHCDGDGLRIVTPTRPSSRVDREDLEAAAS